MDEYICLNLYYIEQLYIYPLKHNAKKKVNACIDCCFTSSSKHVDVEKPWCI